MSTEQETDDGAIKADTRPAIERGLTFEECLDLTVSGPWAHFRRVEGNVVKQTYDIMPRTTVAGMVAAILGLERNSYYDLFSPENSAIAISPQTKLRSINMPENTLSTDKASMRILSGSDSKLKVSYPDSTVARQQHNYEVLVEPEYRIRLWLDDDSTYNDLASRLENQEFVYGPSLGLSEHLASIDYHGRSAVEHAGTPDGNIEVESAVPGTTMDVAPSPGVQYRTERSPGFMAAEREGPRVERTTTGWINWVHTGSPQPITVQQSPVSFVDGESVVFI